MEQGRRGCGVGASLLVLALAAGVDDPPVLVVPEVDFALAGEGAGGELLDQALIMRTQALEDPTSGL